MTNKTTIQERRQGEKWKDIDEGVISRGRLKSFTDFQKELAGFSWIKR